jgi:hypothetical protein
MEETPYHHRFAAGSGERGKKQLEQLVFLWIWRRP